MNLVSSITTLEVVGTIAGLLVLLGAVWLWYRYTASKLNDGWLDDVDPTDDEK